MSSFFMQVGKKIRQHRKAANLTQETLGEFLGIDPSYIGKIERGEANVTLETVLKIAQALKISPYEFFEEQKKILNSEKNEIIDKVTIMLMSLNIDDLIVISRIVKDAVRLIKK